METALQIAQHKGLRVALVSLYSCAVLGILGHGTQHTVVGATTFCVMTFIHGLVFVVSRFLHL